MCGEKDLTLDDSPMTVEGLEADAGLKCQFRFRLPRTSRSVHCSGNSVSKTAFRGAHSPRSDRPPGSELLALPAETLGAAEPI
jgi:hypothetical protein